MDTKNRTDEELKNEGNQVEPLHLPLAQIPLLPQEIKGLKILAELGEHIFQDSSPLKK